MQAHRLPANRGWSWISEGFRLFRRNPPLLGLMSIAYFLVLRIVDMVPYVGIVAAYLLAPALLVSVMNVCRALDQGQRLDVPNLPLSGFRRHPKVLLTLGGLHFLWLILILAMSAMADDGTFMKVATGRKELTEEILFDADVQRAALIFMVLMVPMLMSGWFAAMLAAWNDHGVAKSLFFSVVACWRNGRAFLIYGLAAMLLTGLLPGLVVSMLAAVSVTLANTGLLVFKGLMMIVILPTMLASMYVSYHQVFGVAEPDVAEAEAAAQPDDTKPPAAPDA